MDRPSSTLGDLGLTLAAPLEDETNFITDSWCRSYRDSPWAGTVTNDRYHETQRWTITCLLERGARLLVAVPADPAAPRRVVGFVCHEGPTVHYAYVKASFRHLGIARALVEAAAPDGPGRFTHRTRASASWLARGWRWDPTSARTKDPK